MSRLIGSATISPKANPTNTPGARDANGNLPPWTVQFPISAWDPAQDHLRVEWKARPLPTPNGAAYTIWPPPTVALAFADFAEVHNLMNADWPPVDVSVYAD